MNRLQDLFDKNRQWAEGRTRLDADFFARLSRQQAPKYLWIGCSDSRVPANEIVGLDSGELFVHRNVANVVVHTDFNCLSVIQYAVEVLKVEHIIVCGHYGCGGVKTALGGSQYGLIDNWLRHIKDVYTLHRRRLEEITDEQERVDRLCEINVIQQVANVAHSTIVQNAWLRGDSLTVHGWIYSLADGLLKDLGMSVDGPGQVPIIYRMGDGDCC
ncbi:carbonate dehydratase [Geoalkalibacter sp.]|uniref:carbonate dehydratase n=1 Tax=Geoalkalibacter sp. TaxID=3041440 RepID=UPI00272DDD44|nr:carbonate dehydratase [Geoalkalibacter sp.]